MKKEFIYTLIATITSICISCSKEPVNRNPWEVMSDTDIQLKVTNTSVKETKLTDNGFESDDVINIYAYLVPDNSTTPAYDMIYIGNSSSPLSFEYSQVTADSEVTEDKKVYISDYYWPKFDHCAYQSLHFFGFYTINTVKESVNGIAITGPVVYVTSTAAPKFKYTTNTANNASIEDFLVAQQQASENDVILEFQRPLAKVEWLVEYSDFIGTNGFELNFPIIANGEFNYKSGNVEDGKGWTLGSSKEDLQLKWDGQVNGNSTDEISLGTMYLIPQQLEKFSIVWNYHKEARNISENDTFDLNAGYSYKFTLKIQPDHVIWVGAKVTDSNGNIIKDKEQWITIENTNTI